MKYEGGQWLTGTGIRPLFLVCKGFGQYPQGIPKRRIPGRRAKVPPGQLIETGSQKDQKDQTREIQLAFGKPA